MKNLLSIVIVGLLLVPCLSSYSQNSSSDFELWQAANAGDTSKVKELIEKGANVNYSKGVNKMTPLIYAVVGGEKNIYVAKILLEKGANVNDVDVEGMSALLWAINFGNIEIANLLVSKGADVNVSINGTSPLFIVLGKGMFETAKLLVNKGADVNFKNNSGTTALMMALVGGGDLSIVNTGSKPREVDTELIKLLLVKGADVNAKTKNGLTPLFFAVPLSTDIVKLLIEKGANVNAKTKNGVTVLRYIKKNGNPEVIRMLEEAGAKE